MSVTLRVSSGEKAWDIRPQPHPRTGPYPLEEQMGFIASRTAHVSQSFHPFINQQSAEALSSPLAANQKIVEHQGGALPHRNKQMHLTFANGKSAKINKQACMGSCHTCHAAGTISQKCRWCRLLEAVEWLRNVLGRLRVSHLVIIKRTVCARAFNECS